MRSRNSRRVSRRDVVRWGAAAAAVPALAGATRLAGAEQRSPVHGQAGTPAVGAFRPAPYTELEEATIAELRSALEARRLSSRELTAAYLARIDAIDNAGPAINSVIEVNPEALAIAEALDRELATSGPRGPLHGVPILIKDNIGTADRMETTAGSLALLGARPAEDATVAARRRAAGAVILGKTNLSEWANFRSTHSASGWSGRGGQTLNPYALDRTPSGSSSGSGAAVAASLAAAALGTETDGSIVSPSGVMAIVGIKPTVGLTSRAGVIPIAHSQDTVGTHGRTVADAAAVLGALTGADPRDQATAESEGRAETDYTHYLDPEGLRGARIGVARDYFGYSEEADALVEASITALRRLGAEVIDPANIPTAEEMASDPGEFEVLLYEFKADLNAYLEALGPAAAVRTLEDLIRYNEEHAAEEMPFFGQEIFELAQEKGPLTDQAYLDFLANNRRLGGRDGIDAVMDDLRLDALVAPTGSPPSKIDVVNGDLFLGASSSPAAMAGYPIVTVPCGDAFGLPVGISFIGRAYSEPTLIRLAHAFEQGTRLRRPPQYLPAGAIPPAALGATRGAALPATPPALEASPESGEATPGTFG
ncbi:MAG: Putative secreted amidase SCO6344 [uncultured Thermomicrobiales bacterium]|uniref:Secreted amidase SCO6344 n=1 Tax=uncultured Thermomicrobiales bacterium TaxID=1645740 RepID=A0A6J4UH14_9BACT|nr:MAG: Putative secreted amidase SCO6344 [uncultured Thermomicrobiales bacterium]